MQKTQKITWLSTDSHEHFVNFQMQTKIKGITNDHFILRQVKCYI